MARERVRPLTRLLGIATALTFVIIATTLTIHYIAIGYLPFD